MRKLIVASIRHDQTTQPREQSSDSNLSETVAVGASPFRGISLGMTNFSLQSNHGVTAASGQAGQVRVNFTGRTCKVPALWTDRHSAPPYTMGGCVSTIFQAGKVRSEEIDKMIKDDSERFKRECKILLLGTPLSCSVSYRSLKLVITGSSESGKSTIVKQMKIIHKEGFTDAELAEYRPVIRQNVLDSAQAIILYMRKKGWDFVGFNRVCFLCSYLSLNAHITKAPSW